MRASPPAHSSRPLGTIRANTRRRLADARFPGQKQASTPGPPSLVPVIRSSCLTVGCGTLAIKTTDLCVVVAATMAGLPSGMGADAVDVSASSNRSSMGLSVS
jgi:hypothetical protein